MAEDLDVEFGDSIEMLYCTLELMGSQRKIFLIKAKEAA